jgi:Fe-S-cluster containining protein
MANDEVNCSNCKGCCCRHFYVGAPFDPELREYLRLHGVEEVKKDIWIFPLRCHNLLDNGRCKDYEGRPKVCREAVVGDATCLECRRMYMDKPSRFIGDKKEGKE